MANEFLIKRTAFGKFNIAATDMVAGNTASTITKGTGAYIPAGAIVTGIRFFVAGGNTNVSKLANATINVLVGTAVLGTNNRIASDALVQTAVKSQQIVAADGFYVPATGQVILALASTDNARTGVVVDGDVYVDYLYCSDRDNA